MKVTFQDKDMQDGTILPEGEHLVTIIKVEDTISKSSGNPMSVVTISDRLGRTEREYLSANAAFKIWGMARAAGFTEEFLKGGFDTAQLRGKQLFFVKKQSGSHSHEGKVVKDYSKEYYAPNAQQTGAAPIPSGTGSPSTDEIPF